MLAYMIVNLVASRVRYETSLDFLVGTIRKTIGEDVDCVDVSIVSSFGMVTNGVVVDCKWSGLLWWFCVSECNSSTGMIL